MGPLEGLAGVLMCGLSASLLFAIVTRLVKRDQRAESANLASQSADFRLCSPAAQLLGWLRR